MKKYNFFVLFAIMLFFPKSSYGQENFTFTVNGESFTMIFVEGGTFVMGCTPDQGSCYPGERPTHKVVVPDFFIGELQVTQKLWRAIMGTNVRQQWICRMFGDLNPDFFYEREFTPGDYAGILQLKGEGDHYPMYFINYSDCEFFCHRLNQFLSNQLPEGYRFRMPTEAQWEYAARGGKMSRGYRFSGSDRADEVGWYSANSKEKIHEVGKKIKNELGIYDMSGNVWEWCRDRYSEAYYSSSPSAHPKGPDKGMQYVLRGGSWDYGGWACRAAARHKNYPTARTENYGFRLALEPPAKLSASDFLGYTGKFTTSRPSSGKNLTFRVNDTKFEMAFVEGGTFTMGCTSDPNDCFENEEPTHSVTLSDFYMGRFQVTQQLWNRVMGTTVSQQRNLLDSTLVLYGEGNDYPIYYVNHTECEAFCEKLNQLVSKQLPKGYKFSLPTEAQWEYAARGGRKSKGYTYSGDHNIWKVAWYEENSEDKTRKVGLKGRNELGIYDMSGNVWEWCSDWFDGSYYSYSPSTDPTGPGYGYHRVLRGGSWRSIEQGCRVSCRYKNLPNERASNCGLRLALIKEENAK